MYSEGVFGQNYCGESEIRTRDTLLGYTRFPGVLSSPWESFKYADNQLLKLLSFFFNTVLASYLRVFFLLKMISIMLGLSVAKLYTHKTPEYVSIILIICIVEKEKRTEASSSPFLQ